MCTPGDGTPSHTVKKYNGRDILNTITDFRSEAFDIANSGRHGDYPYDETFNEAVEEGFSDNSLVWTARDGLVLSIEES